MHTITIPLDRRAVALMLPVAIRDRLALYLRAGYVRHDAASRERARQLYQRATTGRPTHPAVRA